LCDESWDLPGCFADGGFEKVEVGSIDIDRKGIFFYRNHNDANQLTNSCSPGIYPNTLIPSYYDCSKIPRINYSSTLIQITLIR
jgi:hypothetical protein